MQRDQFVQNMTQPIMLWSTFFFSHKLNNIISYVKLVLELEVVEYRHIEQTLAQSEQTIFRVEEEELCC